MAYVDEADLAASSAGKGAAMVGFIQTSADAVARTVSEKLRDSVSVFDFMTAAEIAGVRGTGPAVDVTQAIQAGIDSNPGRLYFPPGIYPVTPDPTAHVALRVQHTTIEMFGAGASISMASTGHDQALQLLNCTNSTLRGLRFVGSGTNGSGGGQGLVQVLEGSNFIATGCAFDDANCDGLAVADVTGVIVSNCSSNNASKAALYVNNSRSVRISGNTMTDFGGHVVGVQIVGVGLQISGNDRLTADGNTIGPGTGIGILCNEAEKGEVQFAPTVNLINANTVVGVSNPTNAAVSGGIRLSNATANKACGTNVSGNIVRACGFSNYHFENHDGITAIGNTGIESEYSNFFISSASYITFCNNVAINSQTTTGGGQAAVYLINSTDKARGSGNRAESIAGYASSSGTNGVINDTGTPPLDNVISFL